MTERKIVMIGDPVLRKICKPVPQITRNVIKLLEDLIDTLYDFPGRAGLAAPQIGIPKRVAVLDCGDGLIELINPEIVHKSGEHTGREGCLSIPGVIGTVNRASHVKVRTLNRKGEEILLEQEGITAVCMQHEIDHLDGILYIDHVQPGQLINEMTNDPIDILKMIKYSKNFD